MTIRAFCEALAKKNHMSLNAFSVSLGYKSANSLYRIMDEKVRAASLLGFENAVKSTYRLTEEEQASLKKALSIKQYGEVNSAYFEAIESYLYRDKTPRVHEPSAFDAIYDRYHTCRSVHMTVINCLDSRVMYVLEALLKVGASVAHYIGSRIGALDLFRSLTDLTPMLYYNQYTCYAQQGEINDPCELLGLERSDTIWCSYQDETGAARQDMIVLHKNGPFIFADAGIPVPDFPSSFRAVKRQWLEAAQINDYVTFSRYCAQLDHNRSTFKIKRDLTFAEISGDHLAPLISEGPMADELPLDDALPVLTHIFNERYKNSMNKKKPTWHVMKKSALEEFMQTGRLVDHMWAMRAFTPQERREVLSELLDHHQQNPYMHLLILRDDTMDDDLEFDLYAGECLLLQKASTSYDLVNTHGEYLLTHPSLLYWFKEYFMKVIVENQCRSQEESIAILEALLKE